MTTTIQPPTGTTSAQESARGILNSALDQFGLSSLAGTVWNWYLAGRSIDQILLDLRATPEYAARFPAMAALSKAGHAITETDYINYEKAIAQINHSVGLPAGMYDTSDEIAKLLTNNVSASEYNQRIQAYQTAVWQSPPEVLNALQNYYGLSGGQLTAFFIDPDKSLPLIQRDLAAAQAGGSATRTGFGQLDQSEAEHLASLGLSQNQLDQGFGNLARQSQIIQGLPGQRPGIGTTTALQAQFDQNAQAQQEFEAAQADQLNQFRRGGQTATTQHGALGAGSTT